MSAHEGGCRQLRDPVPPLSGAHPDVLPEARPDDLRRLFRRHAAAVAIVTTSHHGDPVGLLVTSLASVSTDPPLFSFNIARTSSSWPALQDADHIGLHVLDAGQEDLARRFALKGADRFSAPTSWAIGPFGVPVLHGTAAWAVADVDQRIPVGDHVIVVARLLRADARDDATPLLHHDGAYHSVATNPQRPDGGQPARLTVIRTNGTQSR